MIDPTTKDLERSAVALYRKAGRLTAAGTYGPDDSHRRVAAWLERLAKE